MITIKNRMYQLLAKLGAMQEEAKHILVAQTLHNEGYHLSKVVDEFIRRKWKFTYEPDTKPPQLIFGEIYISWSEKVKKPPEGCESDST